MPRRSIFAIRVNPYEKMLIVKLAAHLQRSQSDAIRYLLFNAARELLELQPPATNEQGEKSNVQ